ncbi:Asp23/Gls24 family envelope stress response protein [Kineococcus radiotolerans]|uniref:Asp23/Gls24 family envelope stress response protein n=1 Tax=Kineococcus radiotolerans (strain ATCC BAA-149 / DSM 14245 / SRS30216) TaxID=266940 RepID=A6W8E5_KINRD|nr:Asp23/Gls24 family envelope stress response protein [Kineococcus radiotolerans]ABS03084.1 protein of unknown function DUF322 [Kineococcus radiotolerans SRS30216 = ATCC BAA-149]
MTDEPDRPATAPEPGTPAAGAPGAGGTPSAGDPREPAAARGAVTTTDAVVARIVALAAAAVPGVHSLGDATARPAAVARRPVPETVPEPGVRVAVGCRRVAVDLDVTVEYGTPVAALADRVRAEVAAAVRRMTDLEVSEVHLAVSGVERPATPAGPAGGEP